MIQNVPFPNLHTTSGETGARNMIFGSSESAKKWVEGKSNNIFLHFLHHQISWQKFGTK